MLHLTLLSLVESINLADITFLGYIHFIKRFLRRKRKIPRLWHLRIFNQGSKAKGYPWRRKGREWVPDRKELSSGRYLCYCDSWETGKCEVLTFWRVLESFHKVKKSLGLQLSRQYSRCPTRKVKVNICNKTSITKIMLLILCANLKSQGPARNF